jgi:hypothetical protein
MYDTTAVRLCCYFCICRNVATCSYTTSCVIIVYSLCLFIPPLLTFTASNFIGTCDRSGNLMSGLCGLIVYKFGHKRLFILITKCMQLTASARTLIIFIAAVAAGLAIVDVVNI